MCLGAVSACLKKQMRGTSTVITFNLKTIFRSMRLLLRIDSARPPARPPARPTDRPAGFRPVSVRIPAGFRPDSGRFPAGFWPDSGRIPAGFRLDSGWIPAGSRPEPRIVFFYGGHSISDRGGVEKKPETKVREQKNEHRKSPS